MKYPRFILLLLTICACFSCRNSQTGTRDSYVVMVSFDGFRWDYTALYNTPNFDALAENGVKAERMIPSFPTITFPNHYTLATGLYPDNHGIISNSFYAPDLQATYRISDRAMVTNAAAYSGEPIWVTAEKQGIRSACYFWVGSEAPVMGLRPTYWKEYNSSVPYLDRADQVIRWLKLPPQKRPGLVTLYFEEPDRTGHSHGPEDPVTGEVVEYVDSVLGYLRSEIAKLEYSGRVNLIVLSDHGMGPVTLEKYVNIYDHIRENWTDRIIGGNPVYLVDPADGFADSVTISLDTLEGVSAWQKEDIPARLHYGNNPRFPGIVVVADSFWSIGTEAVLSGHTRGAHGYDNAFTDMHTIFMAEGPAFRKGYTASSFANVEVYGIIAHILDLVPAKTDGDLETVREIFAPEWNRHFYISPGLFKRSLNPMPCMALGSLFEHPCEI
jgi:predicted AlkP superfamily pyrophosphatase or phosphodiesterase